MGWRESGRRFLGFVSASPLGTDRTVRGKSLRAIVGIGAGELGSAVLIATDLVEIAASCSTLGAILLPVLDVEGEVLEIEALYLGERGNGIDAALAAGSEEQQGAVAVELRIVEFRNGGRGGNISAVDADRVIVRRCDLAEARDVFVELEVKQIVIRERMALAPFRFGAE